MNILKLLPIEQEEKSQTISDEKNKEVYRKLLKAAKKPIK